MSLMYLRVVFEKYPQNIGKNYREKVLRGLFSFNFFERLKITLLLPKSKLSTPNLNSSKDLAGALVRFVH